MLLFIASFTLKSNSERQRPPPPHPFQSPQVTWSLRGNSAVNSTQPEIPSDQSHSLLQLSVIRPGSREYDTAKREPPSRRRRGSKFKTWNLCLGLSSGPFPYTAHRVPHFASRQGPTQTPPDAEGHQKPFRSPISGFLLQTFRRCFSTENWKIVLNPCADIQHAELKCNPRCLLTHSLLCRQARSLNERSPSATLRRSANHGFKDHLPFAVSFLAPWPLASTAGDSAFCHRLYLCVRMTLGINSITQLFVVMETKCVFFAVKQNFEILFWWALLFGVSNSNYAVCRAGEGKGLNF